jgi:CBS domain-containing protein
MLVQDLMTRRPVTVTGEDKVKDAVILAARRRISALPVLDAHGLICGIVTEADLIRDAFAHDVRVQERPHDDTARSPARLVCEVMSSPAVTVHQHADLAEVVALMTSARLKSLPVVDDLGHVVGIVSRSDVVRVRARSDGALGDEVTGMLRSLEHEDWKVEVSDGVVEITGPDNVFDRSLAQVVATTVPGVVEVQVR